MVLPYITRPTPADLAASSSESVPCALVCSAADVNVVRLVMWRGRQVEDARLVAGHQQAIDDVRADEA
jgi:hypothetical protein